jgi:hypothetical protein
MRGAAAQSDRFLMGNIGLNALILCCINITWLDAPGALVYASQVKAYGGCGSTK